MLGRQNLIGIFRLNEIISLEDFRTRFGFFSMQLCTCIRKDFVKNVTYLTTMIGRFLRVFLLKLQIFLFKLCFVTKIDLLLELMGDSYTHGITVGGIQIHENNISVMLNNNFKIQMVSPSWNFVLRSL